MEGWPFLLDESLEKRILICTSDRDNPARQSYRRGEEAFAAVCAESGVKDYRILRTFHSESYKLRTRGPGDEPLLKEWWDAIVRNVAMMHEESNFDFIATHNPWANYGMMDHHVVRRAVLCNTHLPIRWTSANYQTTTWPLGNIERLMPVDAMRIDRFTTDTERIEFLRQHYVTRGAWTWDHPISSPMDVYEER